MKKSRIVFIITVSGAFLTLLQFVMLTQTYGHHAIILYGFLIQEISIGITGCIIVYRIGKNEKIGVGHS